MDRYFIYCRKSTEAEDRQVLSLDSQADELQKLARRIGATNVEVFREARSAKAPGRPVFDAMMTRVNRGDALGVLCWKLDRLARNPIDGGTVIWAMKQRGATIVTPTQTFSQASDNTILMYVEFGMAQKYIEDLSRNVKRGLHAKAARGWYPSLAPLGYRNQRQQDGNLDSIEGDPERFVLVRRMWDLALSGAYTIPQIREIANNTWGFRTRRTKRLGGKPIALSTLYEILTNPFYYGWFEYPRGSGQWHHGKHQAMVTATEFDAVQTLLGRKGKPRPSKHTFPLTGLIRCGECGRMITAERKHQIICSKCRYKFASLNRAECPRCCTALDDMVDPKRLLYVYYHCSRRRGTGCEQGVVAEQELDAQVVGALARLELTERAAAVALEVLEQRLALEPQESSVARGSRKKATENVESRLRRLVDLKTSPANEDESLLTDEEYAQRRIELLKERESLTRQGEVHGQTIHEVRRKITAVLRVATVIRSRFLGGTPEARKRILIAVGSNLTLTSKMFSMEAKIPFRIVEEGLSEGSGEFDPIEPQNRRVAAGRDANPMSKFPSLLGSPLEPRNVSSSATTPRRRNRMRLKARERNTPEYQKMDKMVGLLVKFFRENRDFPVDTAPLDEKQEAA